MHERDDARDGGVAVDAGGALRLAAARAAVRLVSSRGVPALPPPAVRESRSFLDRIARAASGSEPPTSARGALAIERDRLLALVPAEYAAEIAAFESASLPAQASVLSFLVDVIRYVENERDELARKLARSPFSGMPRADASALVVAAGERTTLIDTIERGAVPLGAVASASAHAFAAGLAAAAQSFRAQGATARELIDTIAIRFALAGTLPRDAALALARAEALALDVTSNAAQTTWQPSELAATIVSRASAVRAAAPHAEPVPAVPFPSQDGEAPHDVRRKRSHFSASALGMYASCERRWYYRYVCASVEDAGSSASFYGTAFHWALERYHEVVKRVGDTPIEVLERDLDAEIVSAFARFRTAFETPVEFELQVRRARRTGKRYIAWFVARSKAAPFEVVGTETEARMQLEGYDFIGYIDRLDRDDRTGGVTVVDYKTGAIAESAREYRADVANFVDFQLPFYYWARTALGERVTRLALIPLKDATRDVEPVELEIAPVATSQGRYDDPRGTIGIDELTRARSKMIEHARRLTDERIEYFAVTRDADACQYCPYVNACRERPRGDAERFGR